MISPDERLVETRADRGRRLRREWYARNREKVSDWNKARPKEPRREACRRWYAANKEWAAISNRAYRKRRRMEAPWIKFLQYVRLRANKKNIPFNLTLEWIEKRWTGKCELTGIEFDLAFGGTGPRRRSPSVDRIEPSKGYVIGNCRIVLFAVNALKGEGTDSEMMEIVERLSSASRLDGQTRQVCHTSYNSQAPS